MSERPRWLTEAARSGSAGSPDSSGPVIDETPGTRGRPADPPSARRLGRLRRAARRRTAGQAAGRAGGRVGGRVGNDPRVRFERRAAAVRRRPRTVWAVATAVVALVGVVGWLVGFSSAFAVRTVTVTGLGDAGEQAAVVTAAAVPVGVPLARVDTGGAADRVSAIPTIASVSVSRSWPSTVVVSVQRKVAVLAVKNPQGQLQVVDANGVAFETVSTLPPGVAQVNAASPVPDPEGLKAAISVLQLLPSGLRAQVSGVTVTSADLVTLQLGSVNVVWGGLADGPKKLAVLEALLRTNPAVVDVSAPDTPITR